MHELSRRTYLESMGIDSYISRGQLPGAAPTQRLVISRRAPVSDASATPVQGKVAISVESNTTTAFREAANTVKSQIGAVRSTSAAPIVEQKAAAAVPAFTIVAIVAGGCLWLEELSGSPVSRNQVHLIRAMAKALALEEAELDVSQFDWPIHNNAQLDLGEDAVRAALGGFVQRKVEQRKCHGLILLGSACQKRLDTTQLETVHCLHTVGTSEMLHNPQLKKQAWLDLQPLANRS